MVGRDNQLAVDGAVGGRFGSSFRVGDLLEVVEIGRRSEAEVINRRLTSVCRSVTASRWM